ncbi:MAG: LexA family protein [Hyphomicrobium sp.]
MLRFTKHPSSLALDVYSSSVHAGFPSPADDHVEAKLDLNEHLVRRPAATFFARATGESMINAGIFNGDLLIIDRGLVPQHDDIVIAIVHGEWTVKRLKKDNKHWYLASENSSYPSFQIEEAGYDIWGVVTHSIRHHCRR